MDHLNIESLTAATQVSDSAVGDRAEPKGRYFAQHFDGEGNLKWEGYFDNLVTDVGCKDMEDKYLAGSAYTAAFYMGLISSAGYGVGPVAGDTALTHGGWTEAGATNAPAYSQTSRPACAWSAATGAGAGNRVKAMSSSLTFSFTSAGTVKGSFIATVAGKDTTGGILFSAGLFSGDRAVVANDTLQISYQLSM